MNEIVLYFFNRAWLDILFGKKIDSHCQTDIYLLVPSSSTKCYLACFILTANQIYVI